MIDNLLVMSANSSLMCSLSCKLSGNHLQAAIA